MNISQVGADTVAVASHQNQIVDAVNQGAIDNDATTITLLRSENMTGITDPRWYFIPGYGLYQYDSSSTSDDDGIYTITPSVGGGNFILKFLDIDLATSIIISRSSKTGGFGPLGVAEIGGGEPNELEFFKVLQTTISPGVISASTTEITNVTVLGAKVNDFVEISFPALADVDCFIGTPYVVSESTVAIPIGNCSGTASTDLGTFTIKLKVERYNGG